MLPFEFIVAGPPVSHQARNRARLQTWIATVRNEAVRTWPPGQPPATGRLKITVVYYHDAVTVWLDNDNMLKPIQDALQGVVYANDAQITDASVRKTNIDQPMTVRRMPRVLAEGFCRGDEFLYIKVETAPDHVRIST
jgi:Holliday junction resolvase RusA-like endonuclease